MASQVNNYAYARERKPQCGHDCYPSSTPACCACSDTRPDLGGDFYPTYTDGEGWTNTGKRDDHYCPVCCPRAGIPTTITTAATTIAAETTAETTAAATTAALIWEQRREEERLKKLERDAAAAKEGQEGAPRWVWRRTRQAEAEAEAV